MFSPLSLPDLSKDIQDLKKPQGIQMLETKVIRGTLNGGKVRGHPHPRMVVPIPREVHGKEKVRTTRAEVLRGGKKAAGAQKIGKTMTTARAAEDKGVPTSESPITKQCIRCGGCEK